jgi:uncharacterized protein GlcG (DUF336 family)
VVDGGANLVAFVRMDDSLLVAADIAVKKALTATEFRMDTRYLILSACGDGGMGWCGVGACPHVHGHQVSDQHRPSEESRPGICT